MNRILIEKKPQFNKEAQKAYYELTNFYGCDKDCEIRVINVYDCILASDEEVQLIKDKILFHEELDVEEVGLTNSGFQFEYHPGGHNQKAESAQRMVNDILKLDHIKIQHSWIVLVEGCDLEVVKSYFINPIESKEIPLNSFKIHEVKDEVKPVQSIDGFVSMSPSQIRDEIGVGMSDLDIIHTQEYFNKINRNPTVTELKMLDTYWSDHCRHTTFLTHINQIEIEAGSYQSLFEDIIDKYVEARKRVGRNEKPITLMDLATINMRDMKHQGILTNLEDTTENNACSIEIDIEVDNQPEKWLLMFKNETHNHPTEIEPFGGASTCLGGAIRDPLSGRATVYQAMRITGAADPLTPFEKTLEGKLPQRKITQVAKDGYSSYGYQIGANTGYVKEFYHPGFLAKRMELGALVAAVKKDWVTRKDPQPGDIILLLGGLTGRDGVGAAVGSSTTQSEDALETAGAEVQKGNASTQRKIVRLFRNPKATRLIKKCNDFGAGGVSVAIGELADGLIIDLDKVPLKYPGLDGTEVAIAESQERMAVVLDPLDVDEFINYCHQEDVRVNQVAVVTNQNKVVMTYKGQTIVDIDRDFIETNGAQTYSEVLISNIKGDNPLKTLPEYVGKKDDFLINAKQLNTASQKGLIEQFDAGLPILETDTVQLGMSSYLPLLKGKSDTMSLMTMGYNPDLAQYSPFHGGYYAVLESIAKIVAMGGDVNKIHLTFQEYFENLKDDPKRWGKPFAALLGAFEVQHAFNLASIGGKDSMSGSFNEIDVPPTLVSFAVSYENEKHLITREFKAANHTVVLVELEYDDNDLLDLNKMKSIYEKVTELNKEGLIYSASTIGVGGVYQAISEMAMGHQIGFEFKQALDDYYLAKPGALLLEVNHEALDMLDAQVVGMTTKTKSIQLNDYEYSLEDIKNTNEALLDSVFSIVRGKEVEQTRYEAKAKPEVLGLDEKPQALILVYEGTTGEYDVAKQLDRVGIDYKMFVIPAKVDFEALRKELKASNILILPHGYSLANEPEVSGKAMSLILNEVKDCIDHYILGIGAGMNSLFLSKLLPEGIVTHNESASFINRWVDVLIRDNSSAWLCEFEVNEIVRVPIATDQGRVVNVSTGSTMFNQNVTGSLIDSVSSEDGKILGVITSVDRLDSKIFDSIKRYFVGGNKA